jgi:benzodiazapine receptor
MKIDFKKLVASIVLCQLAGIVGSVFTFTAIGSWYANLAKPELNPPNWVFGPVWTTLFLLMGIALYLVWEKGLSKKENKLAVKVFGLQLGLNVLWSILFFGLKNPFFAFVEIIFLWLAIAASAVLFWRISKTAGVLLVPYLLWVSFAAYLNFMVFVLN